ncbi:MAG: transcription termination factor NusA [bacterium]
MEKGIQEALSIVSKSRGISKDALLHTMQEALQASYRKRLNVKNVKVVFNPDTFNVRVFVVKDVVENVDDIREQITLEEARKIKKDVNVGDVVEIEDSSSQSTRISAQIAKQVIIQRLREAERDSVFQEFKNKEGEIVTGLIRKISDNTVFIDIGKAEAVLPVKEQIRKEKYRIGERIRAYVIGVEQGLKHPQIIISRTHPGIVKKLFEMDVPELQDGSIKIERIVRESGVRSKVVVSSIDKKISPIGAFVGVNASRISNLLKEFKGEKIDIIPYSDSINEFIQLSILPAKAKEVIINEKEKEAVIIVDKDQLSLAIGRDGQNIRLAAKLCGFKLDVRTQEQYEEEKSKLNKG